MNITFRDDHLDAGSCLILAISGNKVEVKRELEKILKEFDSDYGKPCQGIVIGHGYKKEVITPVWGGKYY